jgi:microcystin-dependent protein
MAQPYLGQIEIFGFNFAPRGWAMCQGQLLSIQQNAALFSLLGTYYGGNGVQTFALPDLRSRIPISQGQGPGLPPYVIGEAAGEDAHTLLTTEMPQHTHFLKADATAGTNVETPAANLSLGQTSGKPPTGANFALNIYNTATAGSQLNPAAIGLTGNNVPHDNHMPYLALNFCIALNGIFPSRN